MPSQRITIAIILPQDVAIYLSKIQKKHNLPPWKHRVPLHITLVSPFDTTQTLDSLELRIQSTLKDTRPFKITVSGFGRFDNEESVFFARVETSSDLSELSDCAFMAISDLRSPRTRPFTPHITLADTASRAIVDRYVSETAADSPYISFICNNISLLVFDQTNQQWNISHTFNL